jgi:hypothetical protein
MTPSFVMMRMTKATLYNNGLSIALFGLFLITEIGLSIAGYRHYNADQLQHNQPVISYVQYLRSPAFFEATMENWESEFLQMAAYVILTSFLYQKGSAESKKLHSSEAVDRDPRLSESNSQSPWPVRRGGIALKLYEHSLSLALVLLFLASFVWHAYSGAQEYSSEQIVHGQPGVTMIEYLGTDQFWFESLQNWQSEFLSIGLMVVLSIFLRQRGSPESKPVDAPHSQTGHE